MALGVSEQGEWHDEIITLSPGDWLVLYTDGVSETQNLQGDLYGSQRLVTLLQEAAHEPVPASLPELQARLLDELRAFSGEAQPGDDVTLVVIGRDL
jgi:sigma-B regulation protein RsbU (phosphoserine phosphatase)